MSSFGAEGSYKHAGSYKHVYNFNINHIFAETAYACNGVCHSLTTAKQSLPFCEELESAHHGPMGAEYCSAVPYPLPRGTKAGLSSISLSVSSRPFNPAMGGAGFAGEQKSHHSSRVWNLSRGFLLHRILGSKEGGLVE